MTGTLASATANKLGFATNGTTFMNSNLLLGRRRHSNFDLTLHRHGRLDSYAIVYAPVSRTFKVHMHKITGAKLKSWWFNPRTGTAEAIGEFPNTGECAFTPPQPGEQLDWMLVLDDAAKNFHVTGTSRP